MSGKKAITLIIAPNWFWIKNLTLSFSEAGSNLFDFFHNSEPITAKIKSAAIRTMSHVVLTGAFLSSRIAPISKPIATIHDRMAMMRKVFAFPLLSSLATKGFVSFVVDADGVTSSSTLVSFF